jgi:signal transduction histidine kinase
VRTLTTHPSWAERNNRWSPLVLALPYPVLALLAGFTAVQKHHQPAALLTDLGLCVVIAVWTLVMVSLRPAWRRRPHLMAVYIAGLVIVWFILVLRAPWFGVFAVPAYVLTFRLLNWPTVLAGVTGVAVVSGTSQGSNVDTHTAFGVLTFAAVLAANAIPMCFFAWFLWRNAALDQERQRMMTQLAETNRRLEASLAENAGLHERLLAQARQAGVLDERQRMAREIHDTLAQGLTGIITQLQAADQAAETTEHRRHLDAATDLARESLTEARRSVRALRPEALREARLGDALSDVARRWSAINGVNAQVTVTGTERPIAPGIEDALLRTAQEGLANAAKHARAGRVGLTLSYLDNEVVLDVRDDGRGFAEPTPVDDGGGFGLIAMRQRIEAVSGTLTIESEPGTGTAISAIVPAATLEATP